MIAFELPNLSLFLIELSEYAGYVERAGIAGPVTAHPGAVVVSCAMGSRRRSTMLSPAPQTREGPPSQPPSTTAHTPHMSTIPTGLWELVFNDRTAAAAQAQSHDTGQAHEPRVGAAPESPDTLDDQGRKTGQWTEPDPTAG